MQECGDCVVPAGPCQICADGTAACPTAGCVDGECTVEMPSCGGGMDPQCETDSDCGAIGAPCEMCPDGTAACPQTWCENGSCNAVFPSCGGGGTGDQACAGKQCGEECDLCDPMDPNCSQTGLLLSCDAYGRCGPGMPQCEPPAGECQTAMDCPQSLAPCEICPDGSAACPFTDCINGACVAQFSTCSGPGPVPNECQSDLDCPQIDAPCQVCADGTAACPGSFCGMGQCFYSFPTCGNGYDPCEGKACGESCSLCAPYDMMCVETDEVKTCDENGQCHGGFAACSMQ
jgi:hypothetical protein